MNQAQLMFALVVGALVSGCAIFTVPSITDPATGVEYKGKHAVQVYAHQQQQQQLSKRWDWLMQESQRPAIDSVDAATRNMLMQSITLGGINSSGGGEYFKMLAARSDMWARIWQTGLAVLGPALIHYALYGSGYGGGDLAVEENITISDGSVVNMSNSGSFHPPVGIEETAGQNRGMSFGGIGNQVGSPQGLNAWYRSSAGQNRASGSLNMDSEKPTFVKDTFCNGGPCVDDSDGGNSTGLFR